MRENIDSKYIEQATALEHEYFDIECAHTGKFINVKINPDDEDFVKKEIVHTRRILKKGRDMASFNAAHGIIWNNHQEELIAAGLMSPIVATQIVDTVEELNNLRKRIEQLEKIK